MKDLIIAIVILFVIFIPIAYARQDDFQSVSSHYDQYSPDNLNSSYSHYDQYSPDNLNNPYSQFEVQYSPKNVSNLSPKEEHDYHVGIVSPATQGQEAKKVKKPPGAAPISSFLDDTRPKKNIPVFFYLLVLSSLAVVATMLVIIGIFKK